MKNDHDDGKRVNVTMAIEAPSLAFIDNAARKHQMSRTGFMVFASIKYAKDMQKQEAEEIMEKCL